MELKGYKNGEIGRNHFQDSHNGKAEKLTLDEIAKELNISKSNLTRALSIERTLTDSMKELLENGMSYKKVAELTGISKSTLVRAKNMIQKGLSI